MEVRFKPDKEESTIVALRALSTSARDIVSRAIDTLSSAQSLHEAKEALLGDMEIDGNTFSIKIRENFQFVVAGLFGESDDEDILEIEVIKYE